MKKLALLLAALLLLLPGCGETRTVTCDHCGAQIELPADSKIEDDWIVFCKACEEDLFADNPVVSPD
ncbi:MAG: hypothetical protein IJA75_09575 [Oscillospiraceae bacterium]|nr:hypothetical protein [Oscillospiraceae bacterium]